MIITDVDRHVDDVREGLANGEVPDGDVAEAAIDAVTISASEADVIARLVAWDGGAIERIVEVGTFIGDASTVLAVHSTNEATIEVYDSFEPDAERLGRSEDLATSARPDRFEIWSQKTLEHSQKFVVHRGDLRDTCSDETLPADMLLVDIPEPAGLVGTLSSHFYDRLRVGGFLLHLNYFRPIGGWIVAQMELLSDCFTPVGAFGNTMVYVKTRELTFAERTFDYDDDLPFSELCRLIDRAIGRHTGTQAGDLLLTKLHLTLHEPDADSSSLAQQILSAHSHDQRVIDEAQSLVRSHATIDDADR